MEIDLLTFHWGVPNTYLPQLKRFGVKIHPGIMTEVNTKCDHQASADLFDDLENETEEAMDTESGKDKEDDEENSPMSPSILDKKDDHDSNLDYVIESSDDALEQVRAGEGPSKVSITEPEVRLDLSKLIWKFSSKLNA